MRYYRVQIDNLMAEVEADSTASAWTKVAQAYFSLDNFPDIDISFVTDLETNRVKAYSIVKFANMLVAKD